jgi:hypothetical protein
VTIALDPSSDISAPPHDQRQMTVCRPMSRGTFVHDIPEDVPTVADIPDGWMPSSLPFGRDVVPHPQLGGAIQA